jgi:hypothetical protein
MCTLDLEYMEWDLRWLRREARKAVALRTKHGIESKTEDVIRKETDELLVRALLVAIRHYNPSYVIEATDTPEYLYQDLWDECFEYMSKMYNTDDVEEETKELIDAELEHVYDFLVAERNRRLSELETNEEA